MQLAADWDAQAADIERKLEGIEPGERPQVRTIRSKVLRQCSTDLRLRMAELDGMIP